MSEVGGWMLKAGGWRFEFIGYRLKVGGWRSEVVGYWLLAV